MQLSWLHWKRAIAIMLLVCILPTWHCAAAAAAPKTRVKRGVIFDFFQKLFITKNLIFEQYSDTKETLNQVFNTINGQFRDPAPPRPTLRPPKTTTRARIDDSDEADVDNASSSTTAAPFKISRNELGALIGRNVRGLQRLIGIEFKDALNATHQNLREYKAEANRQFANSLAVEAKHQFKAIAG